MPHWIQPICMAKFSCLGGWEIEPSFRVAMCPMKNRSSVPIEELKNKLRAKKGGGAVGESPAVARTRPPPPPHTHTPLPPPTRESHTAEGSWVQSSLKPSIICSPHFHSLIWWLFGGSPAQSTDTRLWFLFPTGIRQEAHVCTTVSSLL